MRWWTPDPQPERPKAPPPDPRFEMLKWFSFAHLNDGLQRTSQPFADMATWMIKTLPAGPEATEAMRKLLEAKDCAVRAALQIPQPHSMAVDEVLAKVVADVDK